MSWKLILVANWLFIFNSVNLVHGSTNCQQINQTTAVLYSPGYPDQQRELVICKWSFINDGEHVLMFKVSQIKHTPPPKWCILAVVSRRIKDLYIPTTEPTKNCTLNYIHFSLPNKWFCGSLDKPVVYTSASSNVTLKYYNTGKPRPGRGFKIEIYKVPKYSHASASTSCSDQQFYCSNAKDRYCIDKGWICNGIEECSDGSDEHDCILVSDDSTDIFPTATKPKREICSYTYDNLFGTFHTTNYPHAYPHASNCDWLINVQKEQKLQLHFLDIQLGPGDIVSVYDGLNDKGILIGDFSIINRPEDMIQSSKNSLYVKFTSNSIGAGKGFNATYQVTGFCKGHGWVNCGYGEDLCYYKNLKCDGIWHCKQHGGDERNCGKCSIGKFECSSGSSQCYEEADRCNGQGHCIDNADEMKCTADKCGPRNGTFLCHNSHCIIESWTCDGANDCGDNSDELHCSGIASRKVITAAVVGALMCSLLLVIALGCTCRLHAMRMRDIMGYNYLSPVSRVEQEIWARRSAPPLYDEAMQTSRPYNEMVAVIEQALRERSAVNNSSDQELITDHGNGQGNLSANATHSSDDELIDITTSSGSVRNDVSLVDVDTIDNENAVGIGASNVEITLLAGATAQWRRSHASSGDGGNVRKSRQRFVLKPISQLSSQQPDVVLLQALVPVPSIAASNCLDVNRKLSEESTTTSASDATVGGGSEQQPEEDEIGNGNSSVENVINQISCDNINSASSILEHINPSPVCLPESDFQSAATNSTTQISESPANVYCQPLRDSKTKSEGAAVSDRSVSTEGDELVLTSVCVQDKSLEETEEPIADFNRADENDAISIPEEDAIEQILSIKEDEQNMKEDDVEDEWSDDVPLL